MLNFTLAKILIPKRKLGNIKVSEEDKICLLFAQYLRCKSLEGSFNYIWFHIPNQIGSLRPIFGLKQGWMGRIPGAPDFCFVGNPSFFIEMKTSKGKQSKEQKIFEAWCKDNNINYYLCRSFEEAKKIVEEINNNNN